MTTKALVKRETAIDSYGSRDEVKEVVDRLMALHPAAQEVGQGGMRAAAQLAVLIDANPLPSTNEVHVWKQGQRIMIDLGINYYRRKRDELGGVLWAIQPRQMNDREREENDVPEASLAAICRAVKASDMIQWLNNGFKANQIWDMASSTGIGICNKNDAKNGRPAIWTAFKRAEKDLYRQLFPVMMNQVNEGLQNIEAEDIVEVKPISLEEINAELFPNSVEEIDYDEPAIDTETGEIMEGIIIEDKSESEPEEITIDEDLIKTWRDKLMKVNKPQALTVASMVANAIPSYYGHAKHALNATDYEGKEVFTDIKPALEMFDGLVQRVREKANAR